MGSIKSGPTLKGWTLYFLLSAAIKPKATVVFPTLLPVPAIRTVGVSVIGYHKNDDEIKTYKDIDFYFLLLDLKYSEWLDRGIVDCLAWKCIIPHRLSIKYLSV